MWSPRKRKMNEWTHFGSWLAWGLPAWQSLSVKQKDTLNQTLEGRLEQSEILISTTHPYGTRAPPPPMLTVTRQLIPPPISEGSPCFPVHLLLASCNSYDFERLEIFSPSTGVWDSAEFSQSGCPRHFWKHGQPHGGPTPPNFPFPQKPEVFTGVCKTLWKSGYNETRKGAGCNS